MRRRDFIAGLGSATAWPLLGHAQQPTTPVIGYLTNASADSDPGVLTAFRGGLNLLGFVEGRNVAVIYRRADGQNERLPELAADLVRRQVAVIAAWGTQSVQAAKAATTSIPIVFVVGGNPMEGGIVPSLNRPAGNITGVTLFDVEVAGKLVEFMHELVPTAPTLAFLTNPTNQGTAVSETKALQAAAGAVGVELLILQANRSAEIEGIYASLAGQSVGGVIVSGDNLFFMLRDKLFSLAERYKVPAIYHYPEHAQAGGLMGYGTKTTDVSRTVGIYVGRILKGEKPADLPVQQATKIELAINLKTAKTLGITFPTALLVRAEEVIE